MSYSNPYSHHRIPKAQHITRMFEVTVLDDWEQREKLLALVEKDVARIIQDNRTGAGSTWHLDLRKGPYLAWGLDVVPGGAEHPRLSDLIVREFPDPRALPESQGEWITRSDQAVAKVRLYAEWRDLQSQSSPSRAPGSVAAPSSTQNHDYEPGE